MPFFGKIGRTSQNDKIWNNNFIFLHISVHCGKMGKGRRNILPLCARKQFGIL